MGIKIIRYYFIEEMYSGYQQLGSGLQSHARSHFFFLPFFSDELVDQLKLLHFEKVGGNDRVLLNEQIIAIADKLLEHECITPSQHQNPQSNFEQDPFVD